jgi:hypothetical protein
MPCLENGTPLTVFLTASDSKAERKSLNFLPSVCFRELGMEKLSVRKALFGEIEQYTLSQICFGN